MSAGDSARHALYTQLEDLLGQEHANTLMSYLPLDRSDEVATKSDIARLEAHLDDRLDRVDVRMDRFEERMDRFEERMGRFEERMDRFGETLVSQQQSFSRSMVTAMVALTAIFSLVVAFFG